MTLRINPLSRFAGFERLFLSGFVSKMASLRAYPLIGVA
jgi:hypothetical protein